MDDDKKKPTKVTVKDKRRSASEASREPEAPQGPPVLDAEPRDYLADLQRLQAEFENYRKRMMREQAQVGERAKAAFVERLLPVLDNFERAISHGEGGEGVGMVFKELQGVLAAEGIEEIPAEGRPFDPRVHEAVESIEDSEVDEPTVTAVHRRGWRSPERVIRAAMVRVARPVEPEDLGEAADAGAAGETESDEV